MKSLILKQFSDNLQYANKLLKDIPDTQMTAMPWAGANHATWQIGHLVGAGHFVVSLIGGHYQNQPGWDALFGPKSSPKAEGSIYPSKAQLLEELTKVHAKIEVLFPNVTDTHLATPFPTEAFRTFWPTIGDAVIYLILPHESTHLGQLSAWRRAMGMPSLF